MGPTGWARRKGEKGNHVATWPPSAADTEVIDWTIDDLQIGDLIFCTKSSGPLAGLGRLAGEPWRHVGAVDVDPDGDLAVIEAGQHFGWRKLDVFLDSYDGYGAARLDLGPRCIESAMAWMHDHVYPDGDNYVYAWDDLVLAGLISKTL